MTIRLRQVALVARDLSSAQEAIVGCLGVEPCFRDPGVAEFGLHNVLFPVGHDFLEVVSPLGPGTTAGRLMDRRGGDCGYMVLLQVDDLTEMRRRLDRMGARIVFEAVAEGIHGLHVHPRDIGGAILSVDRTGPPCGPDDWPWAGPDWRDHVATGTVSGLTAVDIAADDPGAMARRWAELLGAERLSGTTVTLDEGTIRFVPSEPERGEGVVAVDMATAGPAAEHEICGCRVRLVPGPAAQL